jgi:hypothetical protein
MDDKNESESSLETVAAQRVDDKAGFFIHAIAFLVGNAALVVIWAAKGSRYAWFIWPLFGWGIAVLFHGLTVFLGKGSRFQARLLERELQRVRSGR